MMRKGVVGALSRGALQLISERAWPLINPGHSTHEMMALAYLRGLKDAWQTFKGDDPLPEPDPVNKDRGGR